MTCNLFDILNISNRETIHSSFIAWLLNPKETHGLKDAFLKIFLKKIDIEPNETNNADVYNEFPYKYDDDKDCDSGIIDIFIKKPGKFVVVVENKITAKETNNQYKRYTEFIENTYKKYDEKKYVLIKPEGYKSEEISDKYVQITYTEISEMLEQVLNKANAEVKEIINAYIGVIEGIGKCQGNFPVEKEQLKTKIKEIFVNTEIVWESNNYELLTFKIGYNETTYWTISENKDEYYINFCIRPQNCSMANFDLIEELETNYDKKIASFNKYYNKQGFYWVSEKIENIENISECVLLSKDIIDFSNRKNDKF